MRNILTLRNVTVALSGTVVIGLALGGVAYAINGPVFRYTTVQTGYLTIPAAALVPGDSTVGYVNDGTTLVTTGNGCFIAPVNLPQGAKITQLEIWYGKQGSTAASLQLKRVSLATGFGVDTIAALNGADTGGQPKSAAVNIGASALQFVINARDAYSFVDCVSDQETFLSARIKYTYRTAGD
jgi:hypothetical protein